MALSEVTTTFNLHDYFGDDFDPRRAKGWATNNAEDQTIHDTSTGETRVGSGVATIADDGTGTFTHWAPGADGNPESWQTTYHFDVDDRNAPRGRRTVSFGPFTVTTSGLLTALVEEQEVPPTYVSTVTALLDGYVDAAEAAAALAEDISGIATPDALVATLISNPASATGLAAATAVAEGVAPVDAYAKVDALVRSYVPQDRDRLTWITRWEAGHGWTLGSVGTVQNERTPWGSTYLRMALAAVETGYQVTWSGSAFDATSKNFVMWARAADMAHLAFLRVQVHSSSTDYVRFRMPIDSNNYPGPDREGWVPFEFSTRNTDAVGGTINWAAVNEIRISAYRTTGSVATYLDLAGIALRAKSPLYPNGVVSWSFDDWHATDYTVGKAKLDTLGWKGSAFICPARVETDHALDGVSLTYAHAMQDSGWDMCAHSYDLTSHVAWTNWTEAQLMAEWERTKRKMIDLGLDSGVEHLATPTGAYNATMARLAAAGWWSTIRVTGQVEKPRMPAPIDRFRTGAYSFTSLDTTALNVIKADLDNAKAIGGHYVVNAHDLSDTTTANNWRAAVDYAASIGIACKPYVQVVTGR